MDRIPYIGQKDRKIQIVSLVETKNPVGGITVCETVISAPFAYLRELSGGEEIDGKVRQFFNRSFVIRYRKELFQNITKYFVKYEGVIYDIEHCKLLGRNNHMELIVSYHE